MNQNFDPMTGAPITQPDAPTETKNFDPMTGEPIHQSSTDPQQETLVSEAPISDTPVSEQTAETNPYAIPQPTMNYDSQMGMGTASAEAPAAPKKKGKKWIFAILAVILIAVAAVLIFIFTKETPKDRVFNGMEATFMETNSPLEALLGSKEISEMTQKEGSSETLALTLDGIDGSLLGYYSDFAYMLEGFGVQSSCDVNMKDKELKATGAITYSGVSYLNCDIFAYDDTMAFQCPELLNGFISMNTKTLGTDFNNSYVAEASGETLEEDLSFNLFDEVKSMQNEDSLSGTSLEMEKILDDAYESIIVEKTTSEKLTIGDSAQICDGYTVTIPAATMETVVNAIIEEAAAESTEQFSTEEIATYLKPITGKDFVFTVYLDKKDRMVRLEQNYEILDGLTTIDTLLDWTGEKNLCDQFTGNINVNAMGTEYNIVLTSDTTTDGDVATTKMYCDITTDGASLVTMSYEGSLDTASGDLQMDLSVSDSTQTYAVLTATGAFTDITKGKAYTFTLDNMNLDIMNGGLLLDLSAEYTVSEFKDDITLPEGTEYELFKMTEDDFNTMASEVETNLYSSPFFELIFSFVSGY